jgi:hypothetical protein
MKKNEIIENNELIGIFMQDEENFGILKYKTGILYDCPFVLEPVEAAFLCYNSYWEWIVPVVIKICNTEIKYPGQISQLADVNLSWSRKDLKEIYKSVIKYIKWYNKNYINKI